MLPAFKQYLSTLKLSPVSRKLYSGDVSKYLLYLGSDPTLNQTTTSFLKYLSYLRSQAMAPSMLKRTTASLRQFGTFLAHTYNIENPASPAIASAKAGPTNYITHFTNYLISDHLSPLTIKSYKSDITRYLDWTNTHIPRTELAQLLSDKNIKKYLNHLLQSDNITSSTIDRKEQSLTRFQTWYTNVYSPNHVTDNVLPAPARMSLVPNLASASVRNFATLAILLLFTATLGIFGYRQFAKDATLTSAYPSTPVTPNRQLSFQGRLENASGTPITTATNFVFKLFTASSGGTELYSTGTCSITPDSDGVFNTQIGSTCGSAIASSVFTENAGVWLEVTVVAETLAPRQQIATVAYALNSETLQGFPLSSTISAIRNTIVPMNQYGEIIVGEQSPRLTGVSGTFQISAPALSIITATGTNGNITLAPDGTGQVNLTGNTTSTNFFNVSNAQLTTGSLITGTVANANTGFKLIDLLSGSSPTSKFSVSDSGQTYIAGSVGVGITVPAATSLLDLTSTTKGFLAPRMTTTQRDDISTPATGLMIYNTTTNQYNVFNGTTWGAVGGGGAWSDLTVPTANLSLAHAGYTTAFTFDSVTAADAFALSSSSLTTGTILDLSSTSTAGGASGLSKVLDIGRSGTNANASHTAYGLYSAVTNTGTTSTNVGGYFSASGATNNYGLIVENGNVGIGTTGPGGKLVIKGAGTTTGIGFQTQNSSGTALVTMLDSGNVGIGTTGPGYLFQVGGTTPNFAVDSTNHVAIGTTPHSSYALRINSGMLRFEGSGQIQMSGGGSWTGSGTLSLTPSSGNVILNPTAGNVGIGTTAPTSKLHVTGAVTGKALAIFNETGDQNILTASQSGIPVFNLARVAGTAANGTTFTPSATGNAVTQAATGSDTNIAYSLDAKGSGALNLNGTATGDVNLAGGYGGTGCTVTNSNGNLSCNGTITGTFAGTLPWSSLIAPTANLSLAHAGYTTAFTFDSLTTADAFALSSSSLTTGTILDLSSTSTAGGASGLSKVLDIGRSGTNANASHTAYGLYSAVTNTGTTSTNVGGYFSASGATNNYAAIFNAGNVGIGTTAPGAKLDILQPWNTTSAIRLGDVTTDATQKLGRMSLRSYTNSEEDITMFFADANGTDNIIKYGGGTAYGNTATRLTFWTAANTTTLTGTERMTIDNNGNVGIGTTGPSRNLEIQRGDSDYSLRLSRSDLAGSYLEFSPNLQMMTRANGSTSGYTISTVNTGTWGAGGGSIILSPNNATAMTILTNGNVGIGTTGPTSQLNISTDASGASRGISIETHVTSVTGSQLAFIKSRGTLGSPTTVANGDYTGSHFFKNYDGSSYLTNALFGAHINGTVTTASVPTDLYFSTSATHDEDPFTNGHVRMLITSTGNVGIGTTGPSRILHSVVSDSDTNTTTYGLRVSHLTSGTAATNLGTGIEYELEDNGGTSVVAGEEKVWWTTATAGNVSSNWALKLWDRNSYVEALQVDNDGNLILGGDSDTYLKHVGSDSTAFLTAGYSSWAITNTEMVVNDDGRPRDFRVEGDTDANLIFADGSADAVGIGGYTDLTGTTGKLLINGNVGIGTTAPTSKLHVDGAVTGKALAIFNETGDQNILTASQSGIPVFNLARVAGTAANGTTFTPSATGNAVTQAATGSDTNIAYSLDAKGSGALNLNGTATGDVNLAGGYGGTGCTVTNSNGNLSCNGTITGTFAGTLPWSSLIVPTANLSLAHAGYTTAFTFDSVTTADAFALSSSSLTTGTVLDLSSTSTAGGASGLSKVLDITRSGTNANASHTAYGLYSAVTNTGTTSTNVGGYFSASGATNNYGLIVANGNVGIGTTAPGGALDVISANYPVIRGVRTNTGTNNVWAANSMQSRTTGDMVDGFGAVMGFEIRDSAAVDNYIADFGAVRDGADNSGALVFRTYTAGSGSEKMRISTAGNVGIGDATPDAKLEVLATTEQLRLTYTDGTVDSRFTVDSSGNLTIDNTGTKTIIADDLQITGGDILDSNGNESIRFGTTASAVNEATLTNAATGGIVTLAATGGDTDIALSIDSKGADALNLNGTATGDVNLAGGYGGTGCTVTNSNGNLSCNGTITGTFAGTLPWSSLIVPTANLSLAHAGYTTAFTFDSVTAADAFALSSSSLTTGTILDLSSTSTAGGASGLSKVLDIGRSGTNANASHTAYGLYSAVTNTGTTSTNVGGYFSASGATNNYAAIFENGNVGIGTTGPSYRLDIAGGDFRVLDGTSGIYIDASNKEIRGQGGDLQINTDASSRDILFNYGSNRGRDVYFYGGDITADVTIKSTGNVGIGTTAPTGKLHVEGAVTGKALAIFNETGDQNIFTASQSGIPVFNLARVAGTAANGTTFTPSATGNAVTQAATGSDTNIAYSLDAKGSGALNLNGTATGDVNLAGGYGGTGCTVTNSNGNLSCNGTITGTFAGTLPWSSLIVPTANLSLAHAGYTTAFTFDSVTTADAFALSSSSLTTGTILDLSSTSTAGGASGLSKVLDITRSGTNANASHTAYGLYSAVTNTGTTSTNVGGYFSASGATNNYGLIVANGNVGIGTASPVQKLVVAGSRSSTTQFSATGIIEVTNADTTTNNWADLYFTDSNGGAAATAIGTKYTNHTNDYGELHFSTRGSSGLATRLMISENGNVGIGTTAPTSKLHVDGAVTGKALAIFNETGDQNILTASQSGIPVFNLARVAGTAANGTTFTPSATGNAVTQAATGSDTNIAYSLDAKGSGALNLNGTATGDVNLAGGYGGTGCTVTNSNGNLSCNGTITGTFAGTLPWSSLIAPTANLSLAHAGYTTAFTFNSVTTADAFALSSSSLTTGTVLDLSSTSTAGGASGLSKVLDIGRSGTNANASHTAYGLYSAVTNTGTTSTNVGGYFSASGATNNYGLIVANGNVGIGTTGPSSLLHLSKDDATTNAITNVLRLTHTTSGTAAVGLGTGILFEGERSTGTAGSMGYIATLWTDPTTGVEDSDMVFAPMFNSSGTGTERMRITSAGNVGIGTTGPGAKLHIAGASSYDTVGTISGREYNINSVQYGSFGTYSKVGLIGSTYYSTVPNLPSNPLGAAYASAGVVGIGGGTSGSAYGIGVAGFGQTVTSATGLTAGGKFSATANGDLNQGDSLYGVYSVGSGTANTVGADSVYGTYSSASGAGSDITYGGYFTGTGGTTNYGIYSAAGINYFSGNVGIGTTGPDAKLDSLATTEQLRLTYTDGTVYSAHTVDSSGNLTIDNTGTKTIIADDLQITGGDILDSNGNESIRFGTTASAVNEATLTNAATGGTVLFAATGGDADIALSIDSKGADALNLNGTATGDILIGGGAGSTGCTVANATGTLTCTVGITASAIPFSGITSATNTTAAMVVGAGASLNYTSTGTINASSLIGGTWAIPGTIGSTTPNTGAFTTLSSTGTTTIGDNIADAVTVNSGAWTFANDTNFALTGGVNGLSFDTDTFSIDATNNRVGIGTTAPVATALLDLTSTTQGFLAPRMDTTQRDAITTPATGLMIYNTTTNQYNVYNGSTWGAVGGGGSSSNWRITSGALSPLNDTLDLLVGNVATASAKAGFINIGSGTPTATVSAGVAGGAYLTATGTLATTAKQTLTLGNTTTGNIVLAPGGVTALTAEGANLTAAGNVTLTSAANLIFGTTTLAETTSAVDSGAYVVGTFDEFTYSNATNVQGVLNDLDIQLAALTAGTSGVWTDAGTYLYATSGEVLGNAASGGANKIAGLYLGDSAPLAFGADNDFTFSFSGSTLGSTLTAGTRFGINTTTALATLDVRSSLGTIPVASISGATAMSALIVDQSGIGDLFTASKSGDTKFVVTNAGNVGIGVSAPTNKLEIGGSTSTISNASGDITIDAASNNISFAGDSLINILNTYVSGELGLGLADAVAKLDVHGAVVGKALVMFNEIGDQDILTASSSGTPRFRLTNTGSLSLDGDYLNFGLTDGTSGYGIRDNAGTLEYKNLSGSWAGIGTGGGGSSSNWRITSGALSPLNDTLDLLVGGVATSSAKFAVLNVNSGTPTATISGSVAGNALSLTGDGTISTSLNRTLLLNPDGGNVGIGVAAPVEKLEVNGYIVGQRFVDSASSSFYLDPASTGTSLSIEGNIVGNGAFYLSTGSDAIAVSIGTTGAGKLDAGTIDPPYTINGEKFATYMSSMTGVKEETTGVVRAEAYIPGLGYRATLDFAQALSGSDLWLFSKVSNLQNNLDKMVVLLSATGSGRTWYEINASAGQLYLYSDSPATISYRLTAPRFDATAWLNTRGDDSDSLGFVINDENTWSAPESPALLSPIASNSPIMITAPVVITPPLGSSGAALVVEGEIDAATISARVAKLDEIQADTITARNIIADTIEANHIIGLDAKIASLSAGLTDSEVESITDRIKARLALLTGNEATAADIPTPPVPSTIYDLSSTISTASASIASADIDFATINNYLAVIGQAVITDLDVTGHLYATNINSKTGILALGDNTLIINSVGQVMVNGDFTVSGSILADSASFNTLSLGTPPSASSSALGALLSVYNEQGEPVATIDKLGNLSLSSDLTASGSANLAALTTGMITIASSSEASNSATPSGLLSSMTSSNATAGESKLVSPNTELTINSPYITPNSLVYLTPTGNTDNKVLYVKSKTSCPSSTINHSSSVIPCTPSFTVAIDAPASSDISFNWWVIQLAPPTEEQI